jgi:hypothetical protein
MFCKGSAISHPRSPIWNILFHMLFKSSGDQRYWKSMFQIGDRRGLIADRGRQRAHEIVFFAPLN